MNRVAAELAIEGMTIANSPNETKETPSKRKSIQWSYIDFVTVFEVRLSSILMPRLRMPAKTDHPMLRLSDQSRPSSISTTTMIRMVPKHTDAAVTETVAVAAEAATEAASQENDEDDDKNESERHGRYSLGRV